MLGVNTVFFSSSWLWHITFLHVSFTPAFCQSGKSVLANFVSESTEGIGSYSPTQGVR